MKKGILFIFWLLSVVNLNAQAPAAFKYQAVARDGSGNALSGQRVNFQISILQRSVDGSVVYRETHLVRTDEFGLVNLEIGRGTPISGSMGTVAWSAADHFIRIEMDPTGGSQFQFMGTSQLISVPYALHAKTSDTGDNWGNQSVSADATLSGAGTAASPLRIGQQGAASGQVLKWNGTTWQPGTDLAGAATNPGGGVNNVQFNKSGTFGGDAALNWDNSNKRLGIGTEAPAALIHAEGTGTGQGNILFRGQFKISNPGNAPASGAGTRMMWYPDKAAFRAGYVSEDQWDSPRIGSYSTALGNETVASAYASISTGSYTNATGVCSTSMGSFSTASGDYSTAMGQQVTAGGKTSTAMGLSTHAQGDYATAMGYSTDAMGRLSTAMGSESVASGESSTAMGVESQAAGYCSTAVGRGVLASGVNSTAMGCMTSATATSSTAMGWVTIASAYCSAALGAFNVGGGNPLNWITTDPLFEIGNGTDNSSRKNALTVLKNGNVGIGTTKPITALDVTGDVLVRNSNGTNPDIGGASFYIGWNYTGGAGETDFFQDRGSGWRGGYNLYTQVNGGSRKLLAQLDGSGNLKVAGSVGSLSDGREKTDVRTIDKGLEKIMDLRGVYFNWNDATANDKQTRLGVIAQEVQKVLPEAVDDGFALDCKAELLTVQYDAIIPVLIEAVKELKIENDRLKARLEKIEEAQKPGGN